MYDKNCKEYIKDKCGKNHFGVATQLLSAGPVETEYMMLNMAMDGLLSDKIILYSILCRRSNEDMVLVLKKTYYKMHTKDLSEQVTSQSSSLHFKLLDKSLTLIVILLRKGQRIY